MTKDFVAVVSNRETMSKDKPLRIYARFTSYQNIKFSASIPNAGFKSVVMEDKLGK